MKRTAIKETVITTASTILILVFIYTSASKLFSVDDFRSSLERQPLPEWTRGALFYFLPISEISASILLFLPRTNLIGLVSSSLLMLLFTGYVGFGIFHVFSQVPCTCGGVFQHMSWEMHFVFNLVLLSLALTAIFCKYSIEKHSSFEPT